MVAASSVDVTEGERTLLGRALPGPASTGAAGVCRSARRIGAGGGGRRAVRAIGNAGGRGSRIGRAVIGKADDIWPSNDKSIEIVSVDVRPLVPVVHSGKAGEFAGGWLVSASVLDGNLTMKGNSLSQRNANQVRNTYTQPG